MSLQKAKKILLNSKDDSEGYYDTEMELDDIDSLCNKPEKQAK